MPIALIMLVVAPFTPRLSARFGAHRTVAFGMLGIATGFALFTGLDAAHAVRVRRALRDPAHDRASRSSMSPMTASIMTAVPARRAGAGSAMNDATRELGAALGIAVLGSVAASRYGGQDRAVPPRAEPGRPGRPPARRSPARSASRERSRRRADDARQRRADDAFVGGIHLAVIGRRGARASFSAVIVYRYLPHSLAPTGAMHGPVEALEEAAELGLGGVPPVFADEVRKNCGRDAELPA